MLFLNETDLMKCLDLNLLQISMEEALLSYSLKESINFPRKVFNIGEEISAPLGFMPALNRNKNILGYKAITVFHQNRQQGINPHQGIVITLLDFETGKIKCILDAFYITSVRTAAVSAVATEILSRPESSTLALLGTGCQAIAHVKALARIRPIKNIRVFARTAVSYESFLQAFQNDAYIIKRLATPQETVSQADIVVTCTPAKESLLSIQDFPKGCHINAIGACRPGDNEISLSNHKNLKIYLDSYASCLIESDEIIQPLKNHTLSDKMIVGELGNCIAQTIPGRTSQDDITFFKSIGLSIEDIYAADFFITRQQTLK